MQLTREDVLAVVDGLPRSVGDVGLELARRSGAPLGEPGAPVGSRLAAAGLSLSAVQRLVDGLVTDALVVELRGRELWDRALPTAGTEAMGRYYLAAGS